MEYKERLEDDEERRRTEGGRFRGQKSGWHFSHGRRPAPALPLLLSSLLVEVDEEELGGKK